MIEIKEENFIGEGGLQKCYIHPLNKKLCIKIDKKKIKSSKLKYEINYTRKIGNKKLKNLDYSFFSKYYEVVETNLGKGYVYDLIRDETTGKVSKTMADYLLDINSEFDDIVLKKAFDRLINVMLKHKIVANDLRSNNICCKILKDGTIEMIIIDGLGHKDLIPVVEWFGFFHKKKLNRRLIRHHLNDLNEQRKFLKEN